MFYEFQIYKSGYKKKCVQEKMLRNEFFSFGFSIMEISFAYGTTIPEIPKTVKGNFSIFEECRGAERKV